MFKSKWSSSKHLNMIDMIINYKLLFNLFNDKFHSNPSIWLIILSTKSKIIWIIKYRIHYKFIIAAYILARHFGKFFFSKIKV